MEWNPALTPGTKMKSGNQDNKIVLITRLVLPFCPLLYHLKMAETTQLLHAHDITMHKEQEEKQQKLQVVVAGFGRSESHSLAPALTRLGYKACHGSPLR
jgi:hypothetical protein